MPAPKGNKNATKSDKDKVAFCRSPIRGTKAELAAWTRAQKASGKNWNEWGRDALNEKANQNGSQ